MTIKLGKQRQTAQEINIPYPFETKISQNYFVQRRCICVYIYIYNSRTPQLVGSFEALRFIEAEEKGKIRQKKAKEEKN